MTGQVENLHSLIKAIHGVPLRVVIHFSGAGVQALAWLHSIGGSSRTILEATDCYAAASTVEMIGFEPAQFASTETAQALAAQAYIRACALAGPGVPVAGVGCTAAIATDRRKRGDHRACVTVCTEQGVTTLAVTLTKGARSRQDEENLVSRLILTAIAEASGLPAPSLLLGNQEHLTRHVTQKDLIERLLFGDFALLTVSPAGQMMPVKQISGVTLFSGSFNPLHHGHRQLAQIVTRRLGQPVYFELPLLNADKAPVAPADIRRRLAQFADYAPVLLTRAPLFEQKARLFPHTIFVIGVDTAARLIEPRFYDHSRTKMIDSLAAIRRAGCRFLVAGRAQGDRFVTLRHLLLPDGYRELFEEIPETEFRVDISSTEIRTNQ